MVILGRCQASLPWFPRLYSKNAFYPSRLEETCKWLREAAKAFIKMRRETDLIQLLSCSGSSFLCPKPYPPNHNLRENDILEMLPSKRHPEGGEFRVQCQMSVIWDLSSDRHDFILKVNGVHSQARSHLFWCRKDRASSLQPQLLSEIVLRNNGNKTHLDSHLDSLCAHIYEHFPHQ